MTSPSLGIVKLLIVDDNRNMRALMRAMLQAVGIKHIQEAEDGRSGFAELLSQKPEIVITDLSMPVMDGIEFVRTIRRAPESPNPCVPILMVTGHTERSRIEAGRDAGVTEFLAKPLTAEGLVDRLGKIINRPRLFVQCEAYFGPDRRRRSSTFPNGPRRRRDDPPEFVDVEQSASNFATRANCFPISGTPNG
jgi:CheY-like chemotaxis protein